MAGRDVHVYIWRFLTPARDSGQKIIYIIKALRYVSVRSDATHDTSVWLIQLLRGEAAGKETAEESTETAH